MTPEIETANRFLVAVRGDDIVIMSPPLTPIPKADALLLAAWIVALANDGSFGAQLEAVLNT